MMLIETKAKICGVTADIFAVICMLLFLLLMYMSSSQSLTTPPAEKGVAVDLGALDAGTEMFEPTPASEVPELNQETSSVPDPSNAAEAPALAQQNLEQNVHLTASKTNKKVVKYDPLLKEQESAAEKERQNILREQRRLQRQQQLAEQKRLAQEEAQRQAILNRTHNAFSRANGKDTQSSSNPGSGGKAGVQGDPFGKSGARKGTGLGTSGVSFSMAGRSPVGKLPTPEYTENEEGRIVVEITVDKTGKVISSRVRSSTVNSQVLRRNAEACARKSVWSNIASDINATGTITYNFKMK